MHSGAVKAADVHPSEALVAFGTRDGNVKLYSFDDLSCQVRTMLRRVSAHWALGCVQWPLEQHSSSGMLARNANGIL